MKRKRHYTKEQLEFYFKKLMQNLRRIPTEKDMEKSKNTPSVTVYRERFSSWNNAVKLFGDSELSRRKCLNCGKIIVKDKKTRKFCSKNCAVMYFVKKSKKYGKRTDAKIKEILGNKCLVCDFRKLLEVHSMNSRTDSIPKLIKDFRKKEFVNYVLLCPNHHKMLHNKMGKIIRKEDKWEWVE